MSYTTGWGPCPWSRHFFYIVLFLIFARWVEAGFPIAYCSPDLNSGSSPLSSIYMSNGKCQQNCLGSYVFAIVQGDNCWCSNDIPSNQVNTDQCNTPCPGYQSDLCGNPSEGLYGYINIGGTPSGTAGGSASGSASLPSSTGSPNPQSSTSGNGSPVSTIVTTVTGKASTILVTPTPTSSQDSALGSSAQASSSGSSGLKGGQVAGIVIGCALGIGLLIGLIVFLWLRRKHQRNLSAMSENGSYTSPTNMSKSGNTGIPSRQVSQMSSAGLLIKPTRMNTGRFSNPDDPRSVAGNSSVNDRSSTHMAVDQRLNPWAIYSNDESRQSNVSLQDNQDYSRQLRVANPDP